MSECTYDPSCPFIPVSRAEWEANKRQVLELVGLLNAAEKDRDRWVARVKKLEERERKVLALLEGKE